MTAALALLLFQSTAPEIQTYTIDGVERRAMIVAPSKPSPKAPLILVFHGHGGNMRQAYRSFSAHDYWPEAVVVYPEGLPTKGKTDPEGKKNGWQQNVGDEGNRDLKFVDAILARMRRDQKIDDNRVYAMGHSNGGRFTYVLWAARGKEFAAYGPSGSPAVLMSRQFEPRSAFLIAGEQDKLVAFQGQKMTANALKRLLETDGSKARVDGYARYEPGKNGLELGTYFHPGGHEYPSVAGKLTVEFFKRHARS
ncbi:MAG: hypothetical protein WAO58_13585 [Fimbriimonadaceae bacterium]